MANNYDLDLKIAKQSRIKLLELAYKGNQLVNAFHFDFPGLGRVDTSGNKWIWNCFEKYGGCGLHQRTLTYPPKNLELQPFGKSTRSPGKSCRPDILAFSYF